MSRFNREWSQAVRTLWRARRFTLIATGTLALGIGATTALFSVLDPVLLSPLPYEDADALVAIRGVGLETDNESAGSFTADVLRSLGAEPDLFEAAGGWRSWSPILTALRDPMELSGAEATEGFLGEVLGVQPILGRSFLPEEYRADGTRTVILSHAFWTDHMGGNPDVLGRSLTLDDLPYTIVGVLPRRFRPPSPGPVALWTSARTDARCETACPLYAAIARLRPGLSLALANERAAAQVQRTAETRPVGQMAMSARLLPLRTDLLGSAPRSLALLAGAVAFALLCACVNVTTLQLARAATRRRELLVRRALGAGRVAIARLWITETVALAVLGGGLGVLIALWGTDLLIALAPPDVPALSDVRLNARVLTFTAVVTIATALVSGIAPALRGARGVRPPARPGRPAAWLSVMIVAQVAVSMVLLVGTGLLLRSLQQLDSEDPGLTTAGVVAVQVELSARAKSDPRIAHGLVDSLLARMRSGPGVVTLAATTSLPLDGRGGSLEPFRVEAEAQESLAAWGAASIRAVSPGFFYTVSQRILDGRDFDEGDVAGSTEVALVNERLARLTPGYPYESPIGRSVVVGSGGRARRKTIVGVVADVAQSGVRRPAEPAVYVPIAQGPVEPLSLAVRADGDGDSQATLFRSAAASLGGDIAIVDARPWEDFVVATRRAELFTTRLLAAFALCALLIGAGGLYGVVAQGVVTRLKEFGIRRSLGADPFALRRLCARSGVGLAICGIVVGLALAAILTRLLEPLLFRVSTHDPVAFLGTAGALGAVALLATWIPSRRATSADPASVLRDD